MLVTHFLDGNTTEYCLWHCFYLTIAILKSESKFEISIAFNCGGAKSGLVQTQHTNLARFSGGKQMLDSVNPAIIPFCQFESYKKHVQFSMNLNYVGNQCHIYCKNHCIGN